jgi:hypothetical protein
MLEEGEIDEEDLKINDYDRVMPSKVEEGGMEEDGGDDSNHSATKSSSKSSRKVAKGKKRSKRSEKHHHHHHFNGDSDSEQRPSEDEDERIIPAFISPPAPISTDTSAAKPVSLLDLFKTTSESLLVNPVITEKENKPSSIVESGSTKRQQTDLKRKVVSLSKKPTRILNMFNLMIYNRFYWPTRTSPS